MSTTTTPVTNINFSSTQPPAPAGQQNVIWSDDSQGDISGYLPNFVGDSGTGGMSGSVPAPTAGAAQAGKFLKADGTWELPPATGVTSVAVTVPASLLTVTGSPITTSGTVALALATQGPNLVLAGPASGTASATPTFRALTAADLPAGISGTTVALETNGTANSDQALLNLANGANISLTADTAGDVTVALNPTVNVTTVNTTSVNASGTVAAANYTGSDITTGTMHSTANGAASTPAFVVNGTAFTGGTGTTTSPLALISPSGVTSTNWSTAGTMLGVNASSTFTGSFIDLQRSGSSYFSVTPTIMTIGTQTRFNSGGAASTSSAWYRGSVYSGGTSITNWPLVLIGSGTNSSWSTTGTYLGVNAVSTSSASLMDLQQNGTSILAVSPTQITASVPAILPTINSTTVNTTTVSASGAISAASFSASGNSTSATLNAGTATISGGLTAASVTTADAVITGGTINGSAIGSTTPSSIVGTSVTATGAVNAASVAASGSITAASVTSTGTVQAANFAGSGAATLTSGATTVVGTGASLAVYGSNSSGEVDFTVGASTSAAGTIATITFSTPYPSPPKAVIVGNGTSVPPGLGWSTTATTITLTCSSALPAGSFYKLAYMLIA